VTRYLTVAEMLAIAAGKVDERWTAVWLRERAIFSLPISVRSRSASPVPSHLSERQTVAVPNGKQWSTVLGQRSPA